MFLVGGPAFSGKTLLAHLLNQGRVVCLDEPDVHDPGQRHRGIPVLRMRFPDRRFPDTPDRALSVRDAAALLRDCERALHPLTLGMKTAGWTFIEYAKVYRARGWPTIAVVRDIRDALVEGPLPPWMEGEQGLNAVYRLIWEHRELVDLWLRYEELVTDTPRVMARIGELLGVELVAPHEWAAAQVHRTMLKLERHDLLRAGRVVTSQVGIWRSSAHPFSEQTRATAALMGYATE